MAMRIAVKEMMFEAAQGPTPLLALDAILIDTETTTLDVSKARIVQIAAVRVHNGGVDNSPLFESLLNPGETIPQSATKIHGITNAMVASAPVFKDIVESLGDLIRDRVIIGHGVAYDFAVLRREYSLAGAPIPQWRLLDTLDLARLTSPSVLDYSLDHVCEWLGVQINGRHTAFGDAVATGEVFLRLVPLLRRRNIRTLAEAEARVRLLPEQPPRLRQFSAPDKDAFYRHKRIDTFPYQYHVRQVMSVPPIFSEPGTTIMEAAQTMVENRVSSVFVRSSSGEIGIVTESDILRSVAAEGGASASHMIDSVMSVPLQTIDENAFLYRAIGRLQRLGYRHLGVTDSQGAIVGAVTTRNLLRSRTTPAVILGDEIDNAATAAELASAWAKLISVVGSLIAEEVEPSMVTAIISAEICSMTRRAAQLAEQHLLADGNAPPTSYAVLVLGSAARSESQLAADQDNAIVYATGNPGGSEDRYFERLGGLINEILDAAGIPLCKGGVMARNAVWRRSQADWRTAVDGWIKRQRPEDLLNVDIFFDAVAVHGEAFLAESLRRYAYERAYVARDFQNLLIEVTRRHQNPFTLFGRLRVDSNNRIDLKKMGLMPIFSAARVLSIRHKLQARSTADRLTQAQAAGAAEADVVERIVDAHATLLRSVIEQQLKDARAGVPVSTRVELPQLDLRVQSRLKKALRAVNEAIDLVAEGRI